MDSRLHGIRRSSTAIEKTVIFRNTARLPSKLIDMLGFAVIIGDEVLHPVTNVARLQSFRNLFLNKLLPVIVVKITEFLVEPHHGPARQGAASFHAGTGRSIMRAVQNQAQGRAFRVSRGMLVLLVSALNLRAAGIRLDDANDLRQGLSDFRGWVSLF